MSIKRVYIEITNICNLRCAFCSFHHRPALAMDTDFFEDLITQIKQFTNYIYLHVQGEPLLHPNFSEILHICDKYEMQVQLVTNGTYISKYADELLKHSSIRKVSFSMQSLAYQKIDTKQIMENVVSFCQKASSQERPYCEIRFWRNDTLENTSVKECLRYIEEQYPLQSTKRNNSFQIMNHVYVSLDNSFEWPSNSDNENTSHGTCHGAIHQIAILSNGTVVPCCLDYDGNIALGNLHEQSLKDILQGERYTQMVKGFQQKYLAESYCRKCTYHLRFNK